MSRQPIGSDGAGLDGNNPDLRTLHPMVPQGISADLIATLEGFTREHLDTFATASQARAAAALQHGWFTRSVVPVKDKAGQIVLDHDEYPRPGTTVETLATLKPSFEALGASRPYNEESFDEMALRVYPQAGTIQHVHHAGNSSGIVDGAGAVLIASPKYARAHGLRPRARVRSLATTGVEPVIMLTAPTPASRKALHKAGMGVQDEEGGALALPHEEHVLTRTYGVRGRAIVRTEAGLPFRQVLARDIRDVRYIAGAKYNKGLRELIAYYRTNFPELIQKPPSPRSQ